MDRDELVVPEEMLRGWQSVVDTLAEAVGVPAGLIMRVAGDDIEVFVSSDTEGNPYEPGDRETWFDSGLYCETVIRSGRRLLVPDALADPDWEANPDVKLGILEGAGSPIDLLLTDVVMPGMDGKQLVHRVRERHPKVGILLMSGYDAEAVETGGTDVPGRLLQKPFSPEELNGAIREVLDGG